MNVVYGSIALGRSLPLMEFFLRAVGAALPVFETIERILKHFNLTITPGETVAIVGPSGSGKSTIVQLIQRHYDVNQGQILIDDVDIRDLDVKWLREQLGVVSQEPVLFAGSVRTNIGMMKPEASQDEIEHAAKIANAHDFISGLPEVC
ncbi:unnamed protein product [Dibothriocephalus latus]|uniref:ABC transporter domain-containing protein n=1 Tax=Dibothriocephalus latus TaxID=60516 RepID=A0A3P6QRX4_DIBLA|nr:unnamed protein product [Dibothriocephalus latus]